jgi:hypothetical protein
MTPFMIDGVSACYSCKFRKDISGSAHSSCGNLTARVSVNEFGRSRGRGDWPFTFDPIWVTACDGHAAAAVRVPEEVTA